MSKSRFSAREAKGIFNGNPSRGCRDRLRSGDGRHCSPTVEQETKTLETQVAKLYSFCLFVLWFVYVLGKARGLPPVAGQELKRLETRVKHNQRA